MIKRNYVLISLIFIVPTLLVSINGCENIIGEDKTRVRPNSVPANALWVGGIDGGVYIVITKSVGDKPHIYNAIIYHKIGSIDYKGRLAINSIEAPVFDYKNSDSYSAWDGDTLYLRDARYLKAVDVQSK